MSKIRWLRSLKTCLRPRTESLFFLYCFHLSTLFFPPFFFVGRDYNSFFVSPPWERWKPTIAPNACPASLVCGQTFGSRDDRDTRLCSVIHSRFPFWMTGFEVTTSLGISTLSIGSFIDPKSTVGTSPKISLSLLALVFIVYIQLRMQRIQGANGLMSACFASVCGRQRSLPACRHVWVCISVHPWSSKKERVCISR